LIYLQFVRILFGVVSKVKLKDLGERKAQDLIRDVFILRTLDSEGMKDDCAVVEFGDDYLLITTDMIAEHTHIPEKATFWQAGWYLAAINLSDIAAMGGEPLGLVCALGLPSEFDDKNLNKLMEGMNSCVSKYGTSILGGDTKEAESLTITGCAIGRVAKKEIMRRSGAAPGDTVAVTGELGRAGAAYLALKNEIDQEKSTKKLLEIQPRIKEGIALSKTKVVTSCMDISDGLASSIHQLSKINDVSFEIDFDKIPVALDAGAITEKLNVPLEEPVLYMGGDYELLVTISEGRVGKAQRALSELDVGLTLIGKVIENDENILIKDGVSTSLEDRGYEHFRWEK
jgi:thiamine-monophosphate kinase